MSKIEEYVDAISESLSAEDIEGLRGPDTPLNEVVDTFVDCNLTFDEQVELLVENAHLKHLYDDPRPDLTSFETIVSGCCYNLLHKSCIARLVQ